MFNRPARGYLTVEEDRFNRLVKHDRIAVENYFALLKQLWPVFKMWRYKDNGPSFNRSWHCGIVLTNIYRVFMGNIYGLYD